MCSLCNFIHSTIGRKILMAISGLVLVLFVMGHMLGNLQIFLGPDVINAYAYKLHHLLPATALWAVRLVLLGTIAVHIWAAITLTLDNRKARPQGYEEDKVLRRYSSCHAYERHYIDGIHNFPYCSLHCSYCAWEAIRRVRVFSKKTIPLVQNGEVVMKNGHEITTFNVNDMMVSGFEVWWVSALHYRNRPALHASDAWF